MVAVSHATGYTSLVTARLDFVQLICPDFQISFKPRETTCFGARLTSGRVPV